MKDSIQQELRNILGKDAHFLEIKPYNSMNALFMAVWLEIFYRQLLFMHTEMGMCDGDPECVTHQHAKEALHPYSIVRWWIQAQLIGSGKWNESSDERYSYLNNIGMKMHSIGIPLPHLRFPRSEFRRTVTHLKKWGKNNIPDIFMKSQWAENFTAPIADA